MADVMKDRITDIGPPKYDTMWPDVIKENYGKWLYHEELQPGVLKHVSETGTNLYTVRIAGTRLMSTLCIRDYAAIADEFCNGHLRFTTRNNIEFMVTDEATLENLKAKLKADGHLIGGTGAGITNIVHTQGWGPLPHAGHRRFRPGQGGHGRTGRLLHHQAHPGQGPHLSGLLP